MRKVYLITLLCVIFLVARAEADGPPVEKDGTITEKYIGIKVSLEQIEQIERSHVIKLTKEQHQLLKKYYNNIPQVFVLATPYYNNCTCDLIYLIWNKPDTVALPLSEVEYIKVLLEDKKYPYEYQKLIEDWPKGKIIIGINGNIYFEGGELSKVQTEELIIKISKETDKEKRWLTISLPPYAQSEFKQDIEKIVQDIQAVGTKYKINIQICD